MGITNVSTAACNTITGCKIDDKASPPVPSIVRASAFDRASKGAQFSSGGNGAGRSNPVDPAYIELGNVEAGTTFEMLNLAAKPDGAPDAPGGEGDARRGERERLVDGDGRRCAGRRLGFGFDLRLGRGGLGGGRRGLRSGRRIGAPDSGAFVVAVPVVLRGLSRDRHLPGSVGPLGLGARSPEDHVEDRKSTRLNSSH